MVTHDDFTAEQANLIMEQAGRIAVQRAHHVYELGIVDPMTLAAGLGSEDRCADLIDYMIRSDEGLGWGGREPYRFNGDAFEWCGAFAAYCMPYIDLDLRRMYWSSTDRLNAYAQHKALFGTPRERALMARYPRREEMKDPVYRRQFGVFTPESTIAPIGLRAGDIALVGSAAGHKPFGSHITVVSGPANGRVVPTYEGNAYGEIPGRPETRKRPVQGIIKTTRLVGGREGLTLRRWIRHSFYDIDLALFAQYGGLLP